MDPTVSVDLGAVAQDLALSVAQVEQTLALLDAGNTVPFITRYRKEQTGNLDEESIRRIQDQVAALRQLAARKATVVRTIEAQGKLTDDLRAAIDSADTAKRLEDLYLPYKPKKRTLATAARERGLGPLADAVWNRDPTLTDLAAAAQPYVDAEKELPGVDEVLAGVRHLLAERMSEDAALRDDLRRLVEKTGKLTTSRGDLPEGQGNEYRDYFQYSEPINKVPHHRVLAINRGEKAGALRVRIELDQSAAQQSAIRRLGVEQSPHREFLTECVQDGLARLLIPALEREQRREQTDAAEEHAIRVFARNLRKLLLQPPLEGKRILAVDPGFRTGCKLVVLDEFGNLLANGVVYVHGSEAKRAAAKEKLAELVAAHGVHLVAIGNGTACRETEELVSELIAETLPDLSYVIVNEAGASVYSASPVGREEFPEHDATLRGTISIGRRLQDPLSELVKIDPQSIGVGLYQHDLSHKRLRESLDTVVESCVNFVGVDLNTASAPLLRHVSGLNQLTARRLVEWRKQHGPFRSRLQINEVPGIGDSAFTQAAGFLKIRGGDNPLDATWIHPESYEVTRRLLDQLGQQIQVPVDPSRNQALADAIDGVSREQLAEQLQVGLPTLGDILDSLARPGRDAREDLPKPIFKTGVLKLDDLTIGMELKGTVLNVVDFGAFVDIGLKDSGLVHISQLANRYVKSPHDLVSVGDVVTVWVLGIDAERRRVSLTMIRPGTEQKPEARPAKQQHKHAAAEAKPRPKRRPRKKTAPEKPLPPLPDAVRDGNEPARTFGELKQLWEAKRKD
jgi:uncharacterized protein